MDFIVSGEGNQLPETAAEKRLRLAREAALAPPAMDITPAPDELAPAPGREAPEPQPVRSRPVTRKVGFRIAGVNLQLPVALLEVSGEGEAVLVGFDGDLDIGFQSGQAVEVALAPAGDPVLLCHTGFCFAFGGFPKLHLFIRTEDTHEEASGGDG